MIQIHNASQPSAPNGRCSGCNSNDGTSVEMAFAFQPIVDLRTGDACAHEVLVRGPNGEPAASVLTQVDEVSRYRLDQRCRTTAIEQVTGIGMDTFLSINFMPNAVCQPAACIRTTFEAAEKFGFPINQIIFETIEGEDIINRPHLLETLRAYQSFGFQTAIDDFGAGHSGLTLLADFQPDLTKLDMALTRGIDLDLVRQRIVCGVFSICNDLGIRIIAEGVETASKRDFLAAAGITLMQGYLFAKPAFRAMPPISNSR